jgi:hypothetical protein
VRVNAIPGDRRDADSTLLMRAYTRADSAELRSRALDVMDDLLAAQVYGIGRELARLEAE